MPDRMSGGTSTGLAGKKPRVIKGNKKSGAVNKVKRVGNKKAPRVRTGGRSR